MAVPSVPQKEPKDSKGAKKSMVRDSLISNIKKSYDNSTTPPEGSKKKKVSLLNSDVTDPNTSFQIWKYPN